MEQVKTVVNRFKKDEDGAALIEYTVLLGILLVAVIAIIIACRHLGQRPVERAERQL